MAKRLTTRQKLFAEAYLASGNAYRSALQAGYTQSTARTGMAYLLAKPEMAAWLEKRQGEIAEKEVDLPRVIAEIRRIAFADMEDFAGVCEGKVVVKNTEALPAEKRAAIAFLKEGTKGVEVKLHDKMRALELLGKAGGLFNEKAKEEEQEKAFEVEIRVVE